MPGNFLVYCKDVGVGPFHALRCTALTPVKAVHEWVRTGHTASGLPIRLENGVRLRVSVLDADARGPRKPTEFWVTQRMEPTTVVTPVDDDRQPLRGADDA